MDQVTTSGHAINTILVVLGVVVLVGLVFWVLNIVAGRFRN